MFDRPAFKAAGKANFERNYWLCVAVSLILALAVGIGAGSAGANSGSGVHFNINQTTNGLQYYFQEGSWPFMGAFAAAFAAAAGFIAAFYVAIKIVAVNPYQVGACRFFMENRGQNAKFSVVGIGFSKNFGNVVLTQFLKDLYTFLWTLLFIVPGIVKGYAYFCVPYILAENPDMPHERVISLSQEMTRGWKGSIFVNDLSFILWFLLDALTIGILGIFFVNPYVLGTRAEIYDFLRRQALENGVTTTAELPGFGFAPGPSAGWYAGN
jgi:hypothetical protein